MHWRRGVEVGVQAGVFSRIILRAWPQGLLLGVDPYREFPKSIYDEGPGGASLDQAGHDRMCLCMLKAMKSFGPARFQLIREASPDVTRQLTGPFDFVYLDGNHAYEHVRAELQAWWPLVKEGGILGGHDYCDRFGVKQAVEEWRGGNPVDVTDRDGLYASWFVWKKGSSLSH